MKYGGDNSKADAALLVKEAAKDSSLLEFGSGASTQVLAQATQGHVLSLDTDQGWLDRTRRNLELLRVPAERYQLRLYATDVEGPFDLILVDGIDSERAAFSRWAWKLLKVGGLILFHDTRRKADLLMVLDLLLEHRDEVGDVLLNAEGSNLSGFRRKMPEPYVNWNVAEGRAPWQTGAAIPPDNWPDLIV